MNKIKVLSLFDGISCTQIALKNLGIKVDKYFSSEIDEYSIKITQKNFPNTIQLGDIRNINCKDLPKIDLIVAGSPCQGFSFAGKQLAFDDSRSALFFEFVKVLKVVKPKYFLLENVRMERKHIQVINETISKIYPNSCNSNLFGEIEPILINSALVSAQNRNRLYWTNIPNIKQPNDLGIVLKDVLENKTNHKCVKNTEVPLNIKGGAIRGRYNDKGKTNQHLEIRKDTKSNAITTVQKDNIAVKEEELTWRILTPLECERLQTVPDNYTQGVSNSQRYKQLGNGFTVKVIEHILKKATYLYKSTDREHLSKQLTKTKESKKRLWGC